MATSRLEVNLYVLMTVITVTWAQTSMPDVEGFEGGTVTLPCTLTQQGTLRWWVGGRYNTIATKPTDWPVIIEQNGPYRGVVNITGEFNLRISALNADRDNNTLFICEDSGPGGGSQVTTVRVFGASIQEAINGTVTARVGELKTLTCNVSGNPKPDPSYDWDVDDTTRTGISGSGLRSTFTLIVNKSTKTVKCTSKNRYSNGSVLSTAEATAILNVLFLDSPSTVSPLTVVEKENISLRCTAAGNPPPSFEWRRSETTLISSSANYIIENVKRTDAGEYTCTVSNSVGSDRTNVTVTVQYPPDITFTVTDTTLSCGANGFPDTYTFVPWEHWFDGIMIRKIEGSTKDPGNENSLQLRNWSVENTGHYVCGVSNGINGVQRRYIYIDPDTPAIFVDSQHDHHVVNSGKPEKISIKFYSSPVFSRVEWRRTDTPNPLTSHTEHVTLVDLHLYGTTVTTHGTVTILSLNSSKLEESDYSVAVTNIVNGRFTTSHFNLSLKVSKSLVSTDRGMSEGNHGGLVGGVVGSVSVLVLIGVVLVVLWRRRKGSQSSADQRQIDEPAETINDGRTVTQPDSVTGVELSRKDYETLHIPDVSDVQTRGGNYDQLLVSQKTPRRLNTQYENTVMLAENRPELMSNRQHHDENTT